MAWRTVSIILPLKSQRKTRYDFIYPRRQLSGIILLLANVLLWKKKAIQSSPYSWKWLVHKPRFLYFKCYSPQTHPHFPNQERKWCSLGKVERSGSPLSSSNMMFFSNRSLWQNTTGMLRLCSCSLISSSSSCRSDLLGMSFWNLQLENLWTF